MERTINGKDFRTIKEEFKNAIKPKDYACMDGTGYYYLKIEVVFEKFIGIIGTLNYSFNLTDAVYSVVNGVSCISRTGNLIIFDDSGIQVAFRSAASTQTITLKEGGTRPVNLETDDKTCGKNAEKNCMISFFSTVTPSKNVGNTADVPDGSYLGEVTILSKMSVMGKNNNVYKCTCLLDNGSQRDLVIYSNTLDDIISNYGSTITRDTVISMFCNGTKFIITGTLAVHYNTQQLIVSSFKRKE